MSCSECGPSFADLFIEDINDAEDKLRSAIVDCLEHITRNYHDGKWEITDGISLFINPSDDDEIYCTNDTKGKYMKLSDFPIKELITLYEMLNHDEY